MNSGQSVTLAYFSSDYIVAFIKVNPIEWIRPFEASRRGGSGDQAGIPPTPAVHEFLALLRTKQDLFTQAEYFEHCKIVWHDWWTTLAFVTKCGTRLEGARASLQYGVRAKIYNNFYASMIDSLHVWSMLCEAGWFDVCILDSYSDAIGKTDLTLIKGNTRRKVGLIGPTSQAREDFEYKQNNRDANSNLRDMVTVQLPSSRPKEPGNKRWYKLDDFRRLRL